MAWARVPPEPSSLFSSPWLCLSFCQSSKKIIWIRYQSKAFRRVIAILSELSSSSETPLVSKWHQLWATFDSCSRFIVFTMKTWIRSAPSVVIRFFTPTPFPSTHKLSLTANPRIMLAFLQSVFRVNVSPDTSDHISKAFRISSSTESCGSCVEMALPT